MVQFVNVAERVISFTAVYQESRAMFATESTHLLCTFAGRVGDMEETMLSVSPLHLTMVSACGRLVARLASTVRALS